MNEGRAATPASPPVEEHSSGKAEPPPGFVGSKKCRDCHEDFYKRGPRRFTAWPCSRIRPLRRENLTLPVVTPPSAPDQYRVEIDDQGGRVRQRRPDGEKTYPISYVMGGKNVYYFLTPLERGRLQVLPVAYDVHKKSWYDTAASGVRHFPDRPDEALHWTDRTFTFNTACFNCHVSQLRTNYDLAGDAYNTTWSEPGISCESCHGPAGDHAVHDGKRGEFHKARDIKIIRAKEFTSQADELHVRDVPCKTRAAFA